jgi:hypothetical protein
MDETMNVSRFVEEVFGHRDVQLLTRTQTTTLRIALEVRSVVLCLLDTVRSLHSHTHAIVLFSGQETFMPHIDASLDKATKTIPPALMTSELAGSARFVDGVFNQEFAPALKVKLRAALEVRSSFADAV